MTNNIITNKLETSPQALQFFDLDSNHYLDSSPQFVVKRTFSTAPQSTSFYAPSNYLRCFCSESSIVVKSLNNRKTSSALHKTD